jgi:hypothetical protein
MESFDSEIKTIRIKFDLESRPQSATDDEECFVEFIADNNGLKSITTDLKMELEKYPERKPARNSTLQEAGRTWLHKIFGN